MAKHTFKADLSIKGIEQLKKDLLNYRNNELPRKCEQLVKRLLEVGITVAQTKVDESPLGKYVVLTTNISPKEYGCNGILLAKGQLIENEGYEPFSTILAIEFGAGIHYNKTPNPEAIKLGYGVGTFPGQIHAFEDMWFYWDEDAEEWRPTHGVRATMPMYEAKKMVLETVVGIAKEVFG